MSKKTISNAEKFDAILHKLDGIEDKIDKQKEEMVHLRHQMQLLEKQVSDMAKKNRVQAVIAGGISGGIVAVATELIRLKLGG